MEDKILIWLDKFDFLSYKKKDSIFNALKNGDFLNDFINSYPKLENIINYEQFSRIYYDIKNNLIDEYVNSISKKGIRTITINSNEYPERLKNIDNPPFVLYCKGDISMLNDDNYISIVGKRHPTNYGKEVTKKFASELTTNVFNIVSGLADGVDTISHKGCLAEKGKTIAVLAGGFEHIYPSGNEGLSREIEKTGLLVTEKAPEYQALNYDFPYRNRIIAGLSSGVLITEASLKSGTMHTKEYAINYGKDLFVVPGNITSSASEGCNALIKDLRTNMVTSVDDILKVYHKTPNKSISKNIQLSVDEAIIYNLLKEGEMSFDELVIKTNFDSKTLSNLLTMLNFRGIIKKLAGNTYSL